MAAQGDVAYSSTLFGLAASWFAECGRLDDARECLRIARNTSPPNDVTSQALCRSAAALIAAHDGDVDEARRFAAECVSWMDPIGVPNEQAAQCRHAAMALAMVGDRPQAEELMADARRLYAAKGNVAMIARCTLPVGG